MNSRANEQQGKRTADRTRIVTRTRKLRIRDDGSLRMCGADMCTVMTIRPAEK
jgi:hypothetical protein